MIFKHVKWPTKRYLPTEFQQVKLDLGSYSADGSSVNLSFECDGRHWDLVLDRDEMIDLAKKLDEIIKETE